MSDEKKDLREQIELDNKHNEDAQPRPAPMIPAASTQSMADNPVFPVLAYCGSSILMTVTNKYVLGQSGFNLNFFLLSVQVCSAWCTDHGQG